MKRFESTLIALSLSALAMVGCAPTTMTTGVRSSSSAVDRPVRAFPADEAEHLEPGWSLERAREAFGEPDAMYEVLFGEGVGTGWTGLVCEYHRGRDPRFRTLDVPRRNRLVFAYAGADTLLNHWEVVDVDRAPAE